MGMPTLEEAAQAVIDSMLRRHHHEPVYVAAHNDDYGNGVVVPVKGHWSPSGIMVDVAPIVELKSALARRLEELKAISGG